MCFSISSSEAKQKSLTIARERVVRDYFFVGILERFEDTLHILETLLPRYFQGSVEIWKSDRELIVAAIQSKVI